jgi:hypothetical protein
MIVMKLLPRVVLTAATIGLAACQGVRDAFSAHPHVAASVAGQDLTAERLVAWVSHVKRTQPTVKNLSGLAAVYVDYMVFAAQLARGRNMDDSALVLRASWPIVAQVRWNRFHDQLFAARALKPSQIDSAYQAGSVRLFQHILIQVPASAAPRDVDRKRVQAEGLLRQILSAHGANFAALARRYSDDPGTKARGGYLSTAGRGQYVPPFEAAAWELAPGAVSAVVRSPFGFHLIRRPPLSEVRDSFSADVERLALVQLDSEYVGKLTIGRQVKVKDGAPALVRQVFEDMAAARTNSSVLVTYRGGAVRVRDLVRWLYAIDPQEVRALPGASDEQVKQFLTVVADRELLLQQVDSAGTRLTPEDWTEIKTAYDSALTQLETAMGISPQLFADSAATPEARVQLAAVHVNAYIERALNGETRFVPLSPFLSSILRESERWSVNPGGIAEAVQRAAAQRGPVDSVRRGGMRPAPGPAPIPMDTTPHRYIR